VNLAFWDSQTKLKVLVANQVQSQNFCPAIETGVNPRFAKPIFWAGGAPGLWKFGLWKIYRSLADVRRASQATALRTWLGSAPVLPATDSRARSSRVMERTRMIAKTRVERRTVGGKCAASVQQAG
jgi:hypothetical protein